MSPLEDQTVKEGETATFVCELSHEKMHVVWFKNDVKLHTTRTVLMSSEGKTYKLEMREVTLDDISQIRAQVKNLSSTANLKVLGKPPHPASPRVAAPHGHPQRPVGSRVRGTSVPAGGSSAWAPPRARWAPG